MLGVAFIRILIFQTVESSALKSAAQAQRLRQTETPAARGTIYDREGEVLATSVQTYNIVADPTLIPRPHQSAVLIASVIGGDVSQIEKSLTKQGRKRYSIVAKKVDASAVDVLKKKIDAIALPDSSVSNYKKELRYKEGLQSLSYEKVYKRIYPCNETASQVVGFANVENVGSAGIELQYDDILKGTPGVSFSEKDSKGNPIPSGIQKTIDSQRGKDIFLTIDKDIQFYSENELKKAVKDYKGIAGSVIVMNPKTGEIYAAASVPTFDANKYNKAKQTSIRNRALTDTYEPGSTLKCLTLAGALERGVVSAKTTFSVPDSLKVGTRTIRDSHTHGTQTMTTSQIIEQSSNVGTTKIAKKLGKTSLYNTLKSFGLTARPGLDFPGSGHGWLPETKNWSDVSLSNLSFGQGVSLTPIQLARAVGGIANGGLMSTPHLLKDIPSDQSSVEKYSTVRVISQSTAEEETKILEKVMTQGTGKGAEVKGYAVAGKTGTAQKAIPGKGYVAGKYIGSFIGYLPAEDPQLLVLVVIDEPSAGYYGSTVAGGAFAKIASFSASHLGIAPSKGVKVIP
ncbi:MAG: penicillin-binding protein 2 [Coriobacteriia bacterium]|nr:penicillin-binding protein 2 [Coriobacteriia bacterium]